MRWVSMTAFITHCWRKWRPRPERVWRLCLLALLLLAGPARAGVEFEQMRLERQEGELLMHVSLKLELGAAVEEALTRGVAVYFVAEAELMRDRWYWYDRRLGQVSRYYRLAYQPLTRQWRLQVSSEPLQAGGAGSAIAQTFDSLQAALDVVRRQSGWRLADVADLDPEARQYVNYRFRLDLSQLPRPFQIGVASQPDWSLNLTRMQRIAAEVRP